jgi:NAD(P)-dependent dehydrogenase (short-subunit alcohol dehydrogenase family)
MKLAGKVALVTGGSRGVGRGVARALGEAGATVYVTGRTSSPADDPPPGTVEHVAREVDAAGGRGIPVRCDHGDDRQIAALFERVAGEAGRLDVLVNNVFSGVSDMADTAALRFWEIDPGAWDRMNQVGLRAHYVAAVHAARLMVPRRSGLIVQISSFGAISYLFNTAYGVGKAAIDRLTSDLAFELKGEGVAVISVWPGMVRTELTEQLRLEATPGYRRIFDAYGESPLVAGRAVAGLAADPDVMRRTGRVVIAAELPRRYGVRDEAGRRPWSPRSIRTMARAVLPRSLAGAAVLVPPLRIPLRVVGPILTRFSAVLKAHGGYRR